jgi:hypothetical protein
VTGEPGVSEHLIRLPGTEWLLWRHAVLRTTGFPASGLDRLGGTDCAAAADAVLRAQPGAALEQAASAFGRAFDEAAAAGTRGVHAIAADPLFRAAVTWQSRSAVQALDSIRAAGPQARRTKKQRERERLIARYWQRYCAKAETIGFFGPVCWIDVEAGGPALAAKPGDGLLRERRVYLEHWALSAYADAVAAQPGARELLGPALQPHLSVRDGQLLDPARPAAPLSRAEAALIARCDGRTPATAIARELVAGSGAGLRSAQDVYLMLGRLAERGVLRWNLDLPMKLDAEQVLRERLTALGDERIRAGALAGLDALAAARDEVAAAAGDPDLLATALDRLDTVFTEVTGQQASRRAGEMYAGRRVCWEETARNLNVTVGGPVLSRIAGPMEVLLQAARWVAAAMTEAYLRAFGELYTELATGTGSAQVPLGRLWFLAQGLFYGTGVRPADQVAAALAQRWATLFGLDRQPPGTSQLRVDTGTAADLAARLFPAAGPAWSAARLHSPDVQLCADSVDAINRGEFTAVLGEMHVAWATCISAVFTCFHPDQEQLYAALHTDLGPDRLVPLLPADWPRHTTRLTLVHEDPGVAQLGFAPAPGADPARLVPISSAWVSRADGQLVATAPGGRRWPLAEVFGRQLAEACVDVFKLAGPADRTPRLVLGDLVVARQTWRSTVQACPLATAAGDRQRYLAARAWRHDLDLPDRLFMKIGTETKPVFVDLTSPLYVSSAAAMIRAAWLHGGGTVPLTMTEALPDTGQAWVPDAAGQRYVSEVRLQFTDPRPVRTPQVRNGDL